MARSRTHNSVTTGRSLSLAGEMVGALGSSVGQCAQVRIHLLPAEGSSTLCVCGLHPRLANPQGFTEKESGCPRTTQISFLWVSTLV